MRNSKKLMRLLIILVMAVWGTVAYRIYASIDSDEHSADGMPPSGTVHSDVQPPTYVFADNIRDPFRYIVQHPRDTGKIRIAINPKAVWAPPPFRLTGILTAKKSRTAMLEGLNGSAYFLHEGDTLSGVKIVKIQERSVSYTYQKKKSEWVIENP